MKPLGGWGFKKNVLVMYFIFGSKNMSTKVEVA